MWGKIREDGGGEVIASLKAAKGQPNCLYLSLEHTSTFPSLQWKIWAKLELFRKKKIIIDIIIIII